MQDVDILVIPFVILITAITGFQKSIFTRQLHKFKVRYNPLRTISKDVLECAVLCGKSCPAIQYYDERKRCNIHLNTGFGVKRTKRYRGHAIQFVVGVLER
jgi:hypothetical protein